MSRENAMETKVCPQCNRTSNINAFCYSDGTKLEVPAKCGCGASLFKIYTYCPSCGKRADA